MDKRPWQEVALTSHLCNLLDEETQRRENLPYSIAQLNEDLNRGNGLTRVSFELQTHEYSSVVENLFTQADFGFVVNYRDYLLPDQSWSIAWLLQAKRLSPNMSRSPIFDERSTFTSFDAAQLNRIIQLRELVGVDFIRYLQYCPRPEFLGMVICGKLKHLRDIEHSGEIFDYSLGLELYNELSSIESTLEAGLTVSHIDAPPKTLADVHRSMLAKSWPLSWFLVAHLARGTRRTGVLDRSESGRPSSLFGNESAIKIKPDLELMTFDEPSELEGAKLAHAVARGDKAAVERLRGSLEIPPNQRFTTFVPHTITINISVGSDLDPDSRQIRLE